MNIRIYNEGKIIFEDSTVISITLPTESGVITVLEDHTTLISTLIPGEILIENEKLTQEFFIENGILKIRDNQIELIVDLMQAHTDIVLEEVQKAREHAEKALENIEDYTESEITRFQAVIQREFAREEFALNKRNRSNVSAPETE